MLKAGLGSETGQMREASKPYFTEEEKTSYFLFQIIYYPFQSLKSCFIRNSVKLISYGTQDSLVDWYIY